MQIKTLRKHNVNCAECGNEINRLDYYTIADKKKMHPYCAKIRRLHSEGLWWIKRLTDRKY
jgi:2C-methyl-D-erythritol 2,4-cyclodiphosphate synthase